MKSNNRLARFFVISSFYGAFANAHAGNLIHSQRNQQDTALDSCVQKEEIVDKEAIQGAVLSLTSINPTPAQRIPITITTRDGLVRKGTLTLRKNARGNILMCHPAAYDQHFFVPYEDKVFSYYNSIRFDFRRHGEDSKGQCTTLGKKEIYEAEAAYDYLKQHPATKNLPTFGFGVSLGAAVLIEYEAQFHTLDGLILQAPFESLRKQVKRSFPVFQYVGLQNFIFGEPVRIYAKFKYGIRLTPVYPERSIHEINTPIFLMHAHNDPVIDFSACETLKREGGHCIVQTWEPTTGRHTELLKTFPDIYVQKCNAFLNKLCTARLHNIKVTPAIYARLKQHKFGDDGKLKFRLPETPNTSVATYTTLPSSTTKLSFSKQQPQKNIVITPITSKTQINAIKQIPSTNKITAISDMPVKKPKYLIATPNETSKPKRRNT